MAISNTSVAVDATVDTLYTATTYAVVSIHNQGTNTIAVGGSTVTYATGVRVAAGETYTTPQLSDGDVVAAICDTAESATVSVVAYT